MNNKILKFLDNWFKYDEFGNPHSKNKLIYYLFAPIFLFLEYSVYKYFWKKIVVEELFSNQKFIDFLEKNDFDFAKTKFISIGVIDESNEYHNSLSLDELKIGIKKEYIETLSTLFKEIPLNIEDLITLIVNTEIRYVNEKNNRYKSKIYIISIQFYRYYFLKKIKNICWIWISILFVLILISILIWKIIHF